MDKGKGVNRLIYLPNQIDEIVETTRRRLGYSRSSFYRYAVTLLLQDLNILTKTVNASIEKEGETKNV
ncbi:MAG: hypothetical protein QXJ75_00480 [Candidatus Bathyarchaeia archaeon]